MPGLVPEGCPEALALGKDLTRGGVTRSRRRTEDDLELVARVEEHREPAAAASDAVGLESCVTDLGAAGSGPRDAPRSRVVRGEHVDVVALGRDGRGLGQVV